MKKNLTGFFASVFLPALLLSGFWLMVFYPGHLSPDGIGHWRQALSSRYSSFHPPVLAMLLHVSQKFCRTPALFVFIQGTFFWASIFYLLRQVLRGSKFFFPGCLLMAALPPLWLFSAAAVSNTWMTSAALLGLSFLIRADRKRDRTSYGMSVLLFSAAVMFRREAFAFAVILVPMEGFLFGKARSNLRRGAVAFLILLCLFLPAKIIETGPWITRRGNAFGHILFHKYIGSVVYAKPAMSGRDFAAEKEIFNRIFPDGDFERLTERYQCFNTVCFRDPLKPLIKPFSKNQNGMLVRELTRLLVWYPQGLLKHQACLISHLLQFPRLLYDNWGLLRPLAPLETQRVSLGVNLRSRLPEVFKAYRRLMPALMGHPLGAVLFRHWIFVAILAVYLLSGLIRRRSDWILLSSLGLVNFLALCVFGITASWRMLLLPYICAWICLTTAWMPRAAMHLCSLRACAPGKKKGPEHCRTNQ